MQKLCFPVTENVIQFSATPGHALWDLLGGLIVLNKIFHGDKESNGVPLAYNYLLLIASQTPKPSVMLLYNIREMADPSENHTTYVK